MCFRLSNRSGPTWLFVHELFQGGSTSASSYNTGGCKCFLPFSSSRTTSKPHFRAKVLAYMTLMQCLQIIWTVFDWNLNQNTTTKSYRRSHLRYEYTSRQIVLVLSDISAMFCVICKVFNCYKFHYDDVIMTTIAYQITSLTVVYSTVYSDADHRKHQSSASLAFVWGIHRDRWIPRTKGQLRGKCFHLMTSSCISAIASLTEMDWCCYIGRCLYDHVLNWSMSIAADIDLSPTGHRPKSHNARVQ